jgi:hypothetical protein
LNLAKKWLTITGSLESVFKLKVKKIFRLKMALFWSEIGTGNAGVVHATIRTGTIIV